MELKAVLFLQYSRLALTRLVPAAFAAAAGFAGAQSPAAAAPRETVLYSFTGGNDGGNPHGVIFGNNGALYGTAQSGGTGHGTVFKLTPPAKGQTAWSETVLHNFGATGDGLNPSAGLNFGEKGALYGTTLGGGASGNGTVFRLKR